MAKLAVVQSKYLGLSRKMVPTEKPRLTLKRYANVCFEDIKYYLWHIQCSQHCKLELN